MASTLEDALLWDAPVDPKSLSCFLHDAYLLSGRFSKGRNLFELKFRLGYPKSEASAPKFVTLKAASMRMLLTSVWRGDCESSVIPESFFRKCKKDAVYLASADLFEQGSRAYIRLQGVSDSKGYGVTVVIEGAFTWFADGAQKSLDELIEIGERQWDLWEEKAKARREAQQK